MSIRRTLAAVCLVLAASAAAAAQSTLPDAVKETLNEGASLYRAGRFVEAQEHFERALREAPDSAMIAIFVARAVHQQYKPGLQTPDNRAKGEETIAAYERVLRLAAGKNTHKDDAYKALLFIHGKMGHEAQVRALLLRRADDVVLTAEQRADAFVILASKQWQCSYDITERKEHKRVVGKGDGAAVRYTAPRADAQLDVARRCVEEGSAFVEQAERLAPAEPNVFAYKAHLLREAAKLAEMDGDEKLKGHFDSRSAEAQEKYKRLTAERDKEKDKQDDAAPRPADESDPSL